MRTDGQTERQADMTKLIVAFRKFSNTLNKTQTSHCKVKTAHGLQLYKHAPRLRPDDHLNKKTKRAPQREQQNAVQNRNASLWYNNKLQFKPLWIHTVMT